ncbi:MAG: class I SAM-dependent methyltransferase [Candidatus Aminicenantaceae bacterium]
MSSKKYFEDVAHQWDEMRKEFFPDNVRDVAFSKANIQRGKIAADIGAGTGFITEALIHKGLKVIAVDQSAEMIEVMKNKFKDTEQVDYRIGESENLPLEDESIDYVFSNMYLHHVESPPEAIKEMVRVLKKGGKLIITDLDEHNFEFLKTEQQDRWMGFDREDIKRWFIEAGLTSVQVDCVGENCCTTSTRGGERASISIFIASGEK